MTFPNPRRLVHQVATVYRRSHTTTTDSELPPIYRNSSPEPSADRRKQDDSLTTLLLLGVQGTHGGVIPPRRGRSRRTARKPEPGVNRDRRALRRPELTRSDPFRPGFSDRCRPRLMLWFRLVAKARFDQQRGAIHHAAGINVDEVFQDAVSHVHDRLVRAVAHAFPVPAFVGGHRPGTFERDRAPTRRGRRRSRRRH